MQQGTAGNVRGDAPGPVLDERLDGPIQGDGVRLPDFPGLHGALPQGHAMLAMLGSTCNSVDTVNTQQLAQQMITAQRQCLVRKWKVQYFLRYPEMRLCQSPCVRT